MTGFSLSGYLAARATDALQRRGGALIENTLAQAGARTGIRLRLCDGLWPSDAVFERQDDKVHVAYSRILPAYWVLHLSKYAAAYLFWFNACGPEV